MRKKLSVALLLILVAIVIGSFFVHVRSLSCQGISCENIEPGFESKVKASSLINARNLVIGTLSNKKSIESFEYRMNVLGEISVFVKLKKADIALQAEGSNEISLFTKEGEFVETREETDAPTIKIYSTFDVSRANFVINLASEIYALLPVIDMNINNDSLKVKTREGVVAIYPLTGDIDLLLGKTIATFSQLNGATEKFNIVGEDGNIKSVTEVDFRFEKPVLR